MFKIIFFCCLALVVLISACVVTYIYAEHHELHKVRAEFDHILEKIGPSSRYRKGLEFAEKLIDDMDNDFNGDLHDKESN